MKYQVGDIFIFRRSKKQDLGISLTYSDIMIMDGGKRRFL